VQALLDRHIPEFLKELQYYLDQRPDFKFICGDKVTIYDMVIAGYMYNVMLNPKGNCADIWADTMAKHCPEGVQKYLQNFREDLKEYFQNRPECEW
jgi:hypothetical protein